MNNLFSGGVLLFFFILNTSLIIYFFLNEVSAYFHQVHCFDQHLFDLQIKCIQNRTSVETRTLVSDVKMKQNNSLQLQNRIWISDVNGWVVSIIWTGLYKWSFQGWRIRSCVTLTFDPPGYRLLVTLVFQQIHLILPLTLTLSSCGQNLNRDTWRKCNILLKSMQCLSHWFNQRINDAKLYSGNEWQCVFLDKKEKKNHKKQFFHLSECFLRKTNAW